MDKSKEVYKLVLGYFKGNEKKTDLWFKTPNPLLGVSPDWMVEFRGEDHLLKWVKDRLDENEAMEQEEDRRCKHGHSPTYDDPICFECTRENVADFAYERAARIVDEEVAEHPEVPAEFLRNLAERIRELKSKEPRIQTKFDALCPICGGTGKAEAALEGHPDVVCSNCGGKGRLEARLAEGTLYAEKCTKCGNHIGGCIVGGSSPLKEVPKPKECPYCSGPTMYEKCGET